MREKTVEKKIRAHLHSIGASSHKYHGSGYGELGHPDLYGTLPGGRAYFFEIKRPGKKPRPNQVAWLNREKKYGALTASLDSLEELEAMLSTALSPS